MAEESGRYTVVGTRTRVLYVAAIVATIAATAPGMSALLYGWGLHDKVRFILTVISAFGTAQLVAVRLGVAHVRGVATPCPAWLRAPLGTALLLGAVATLVSAGVLSMLGPYDVAGLIVGGLAAIGYLVRARRRQVAKG